MKIFSRGLAALVLATTISCNRTHAPEVSDPLEDNFVYVFGDVRTNKFLITQAAPSEMKEIESQVSEEDKKYVHIQLRESSEGAYIMEVDRPEGHNWEWLLSTIHHSSLRSGYEYHIPPPSPTPIRLNR